ncbi:lipase 3-like [Topomyia yanbarensis]|uniref:lipase 3-like n=1 Tax=Topomyia yanbarensis TaxID=2498891 RepID=UPI00273C1247|nr:lipase 3-like [Topomyia yanbarensis]
MNPCGVFLLSLLTLVQLSFCLKPDEQLKQTISKHGYPVELHKIVTDDGYILTVSRIPSPGKPPLLIAHGLFGCSVDSVIQGPNKSLAFMAFESGFDVWMGNNRGTTFSKAHQSLNANSREFWQFSFHELGLLDLPAMVDYILKRTQRNQLHFIGHSQGATQFLVLNSIRPAYNAKFASVHLSAPVAFMHHSTTPAVFLAARLDELEGAVKTLGIYEIAGRGKNSYMDIIAFGVKTGFIPTDLVLLNMWYFIGYHDSVNRSMVPDLMQYSPAGGSAFSLIHYVQLYNAKSFQLYDYKANGNFRRYGRRYPPIYPLHKITAPVSLYYSTYDSLNQPGDVDELARRLPNVTRKFKIPDSKWNHLDFLYASEAHHVYRIVLSGMKKD